MKVGDLVKFRMPFCGDEDWSPPTLIVAKFDTGRHEASQLYVGLCEGIRCIVDAIRYDIKTISERQ